MQYTPNYNLITVEGTDVVNPLVQMNPNFTDIDAAMFANKQAVIGSAAEIVSGTVHAITRGNPDSDYFRFTATGNWMLGDSMSVDGVTVSVFLSDGTTPGTGAYVINTEVLALLSGSRVTLIISGSDNATINNKADKTDLSTIIETSPTSSQIINDGEIFYLDGSLVRAKITISAGDAFTLNTNYESLSKGSVNEFTKNKFAGSIDLAAYNSASNPYTIPADGYVRLRNNGESSGRIEVNVNGVDLIVGCYHSGNPYETNSIFVRKGTVVYYINPNSLANFLVIYNALS